MSERHHPRVELRALAPERDAPSTRPPSLAILPSRAAASSACGEGRCGRRWRRSRDRLRRRCGAPRARTKCAGPAMRRRPCRPAAEQTPSSTRPTTRRASNARFARRPTHESARCHRRRRLGCTARSGATPATARWASGRRPGRNRVSAEGAQRRQLSTRELPDMINIAAADADHRPRDSVPPWDSGLSSAVTSMKTYGSRGLELAQGRLCDGV